MPINRIDLHNERTFPVPLAVARRVRRAFYNDMAPAHVARHNFRQWLRSATMLGARWVQWQGPAGKPDN